jgi:hypothetical protein
MIGFPLSSSKNAAHTQTNEDKQRQKGVLSIRTSTAKVFFDLAAGTNDVGLNASAAPLPAPAAGAGEAGLGFFAGGGRPLLPLPPPPSSSSLLSDDELSP